MIYFLIIFLISVVMIFCLALCRAAAREDEFYNNLHREEKSTDK